MAKVCERCSTMYSEYMSVCPKDGTDLGITPVDEDTLVLDNEKSASPANRTNVRSRCDKCSSDWSEWLEICPRDKIPTTISIGSRFQVWETLIHDPHVAVYKAKDVFTQRKVVLIILTKSSSELNDQLASFFTKSAQVNNADVATMGLLDDGRPFAICNPKTVH